MGNIDITLLTSKRTSLSVDGLAASVIYQQGGYRVVAGENNATTIGVHFPPTYLGQSADVYMRNAKGEYASHDFGTLESINQEFTLPASMTFAGNTILVFHAVTGEGDSQIKTVWEKVVIPIAATGEDYQAVAMASPDILAQAIAVAAAAENGDFEGKSCWIKFADNQQGIGMTATWSVGKNFMGIRLAVTDSSNPADYTWTLFSGESMPVDDTTATTSPSYTLVKGVDKSFLNNNYTAPTVVIPSTIAHGFYAGVTFANTNGTIQSLTITNQSGYTLKLVVRGRVAASYTPPSNGTIRILFECDGINVYAHISEVVA